MKESIGAKLSLYPSLVVLVGAMVEKRPNFITIAHVGITDLGTISLSMNKSHFTNAGIRDNGVFSVNIPSEDMVKKVDYCGITSGKRVDKSGLFKVFFGKLKAAPMIEECPVNMECELVKTVDFPNHDLFIGKVVETYTSPQFMTGKAIDIGLVKPLLFAMGDKSYHGVGKKVGDAWSIGKELKEKK